MINKNGYRLNIGIVICNINGKLLLVKKYGKKSWQFPQGGININETLKQAMYRELFEELGLNKKDIRILSLTNNWLYYKIPKKFIKWNVKPICIGQKQKWFLLQLICKDENINMKIKKIPELDNWKWVNFWYPIHKIIFFKKEVYLQVMKEFFSIVNFIKLSNKN